MSYEVVRSGEPHATHLADVGFLSRVYALMHLEVARIGEPLATALALLRPLHVLAPAFPLLLH
jgi:hypothetical protein